MQRILGHMRRAVAEYDMIQDGDRICVGVSGGKDSLVLLCGLARLRQFIGISFDIEAVTIDPVFGGERCDYSAVTDLCGQLGIRHTVVVSEIGDIVFNIRKEKHPCSLCAHLRRGALHNAAVDLGCTKIALGHSLDDAVETFFMNLFNEGRIGCFSPLTHLEKRDLYMIRPLIFAEEKEIRRAANRAGLPIVKSKCPADGNTNRQRMKEFVRDMEHRDHGFRERIFGAMRRGDIDGMGGVNYVPPVRKDVY
ncbi:MAG: tRNA 2-thiocytidine biosynthesis protein TtcA [Ruminococcus sp.]|nr:tRNA 2-thiocytidine biosynthesis protein TtcA [Ruminococcus sp.]